MIKLLIFDLDGVLISKDVHYVALNNALQKLAPDFVIPLADHIERFDGLPTSRKLQMLSQQGLPVSLHDSIRKLKQEYTEEYLDLFVHKDENLISVFKSLHNEGYRIHIASNVVRYTVESILWRKGIRKFVDHVISNEDVRHPKPNPEMYLQCMVRAGVGPKETIIIDLPTEKQTVLNSGALFCPVNSVEEITIEKIRTVL